MSIFTINKKEIKCIRTKCLLLCFCKTCDNKGIKCNIICLRSAPNIDRGDCTNYEDWLTKLRS